MGKRSARSSTRKKPAILFTRIYTDYSGGKPVKQYFACTKEGTPEESYQDEVLVRISKEQYHRINARIEREKFNTLRKQGGKRGAGVVPGAGHCWPMVGDALACTSRTVEKNNEYYKRKGCNARHLPDGRVYIPDAGEYKKLLKIRGAHQNNSYN